MESKDISKEEIIQSLSYYIAGESGVDEKISPEEAGGKGAFVSDIIETGKKYVDEEITPEEAEDEIIRASVSYSVFPWIDKVVDKGVDAIIDTIIKTIPEKLKIVKLLLEKAKPLIKKIVKGKLLEKTIQATHKIWKKTKDWIKNKADK